MAKKKDLEQQIKILEQEAKEADLVIGSLVKQRDEADQVASRAKAAVELEKPPFSVARLLEFEIGARKAAEEYESGPNSDAVKAALTNASHGIAHVRKALDQVRRLSR